jgi:hypothetical protein
MPRSQDAVGALSYIARVVQQTPLFATAEPDISGPVPVRAGSGLVCWDHELLIIQDDTLGLAWLNPMSMRCRMTSLGSDAQIQRFDATLGNKARKPDFEAITCLPWPLHQQESNAATDHSFECAFAFGSGSSANRERVAQIQRNGDFCMLDASRWYAQMRTLSAEVLNIEAAVAVGEAFWLIHRGNGHAYADNAPRNVRMRFTLASVLAYLAAPEHAPLPQLLDVRRMDMGALAGAARPVAWGFADACLHQGHVWFLLSAEDSPNALDDGAVLGCALGYFDATDTPHFGFIADQNGQSLKVKLEGLASAGATGFYAVSDDDDPTRASALFRIALT